MTGSAGQLTVLVVSRRVNRRSLLSSAPGASALLSSLFQTENRPRWVFSANCLLPVSSTVGAEITEVSPAAALPPFASVQVGTGSFLGVFCLRSRSDVRRGAEEAVP